MSRYTITGRLVQGDPLQMQGRTDPKTKAPKMRTDPTTGQQVQITQAFVAIAVPKTEAARHIIPGNPSYEQVKAILDTDARSSWPQFFNGQRPQGLQFPASLPMDCTNPKFANKIIDGDGFDENGQPNSAKEGWAGCWIVKCANGYAPKVFEWTASGWQETIHTGRKIKCGDYVTVSGDCVSNKSNESPGMYMNFDTVSFEAEGPFIASGSSVDPNTALGQRGAPANPPGPASAGAASTGTPVAGAVGSTTAPGYSGYRDPAAGSPPPPPPAPPPAAPAGPQMTAAATTTYEAYRAAGWTDDQLRASGFMV
jgi:hypothetical protein